MDLDLFYYRVLAEFEKMKGKRSYYERTIFDRKGEKMRRKLEKGYIAGVNSAIKSLKATRKVFLKEYENNQMEHQERTFIQ